MAGDLQMVEKETENSLIATTERAQNPWQWKVQYARCFTYPSSHQSEIATTPSTSLSLLSPLKRSHFKQIWISSSGLATVSILPSDDGSFATHSIITVSLQGIVLEEHFISKLQFFWPQVSCLSGFPARGCLVVLASYIDNSDEKQKFAMRFTGVSEAQYFMTSLEDILSNRFPNGPPTAENISEISSQSFPQNDISSQSEFVPAYRPDTSSVVTPAYEYTSPKNWDKEGQQDSQTQDTVADSQSMAEVFPPRFTSLVSSCAAEHEQGKLALALAPGLPDSDLKAQISKYMQDASFLDMVSKVNEVITELGGDFEI